PGGGRLGRAPGYEEPNDRGPWRAGDSPRLRSRPSPARCRSARRTSNLAPQAASWNPPPRLGSPPVLPPTSARSIPAPAAGDPPSGKPKAEPAEAPPFLGHNGLSTTQVGEWA